MKQKWYLSTWFISLMFAFWFLVIPGIAGAILLIMKYIVEKKASDEYQQRTLYENYNFSDYDGLSSQECKSKIALIKTEESNLVKSGKAVTCTLPSATKAMLSKKILRMFNSECDNVLLNLTFSNIDASREKIIKSFDTINALYVNDKIQLSKALLDYKLKELDLAFTFEQKKFDEKEQQKAIKAQIIEEEKVRREAEREQERLKKDKAQISNEQKRLERHFQQMSDPIERENYRKRIAELEKQLEKLRDREKKIKERTENPKAGFVYVISNIGSFGDDVYKIGMTRRLEPLDRIDELNNASVPFEFDVHAMIFSDDAPALESMLHQAFTNKRVNRVNLRKEFFHVSLDEIEKLVKDKFSSTTQFTEIPIAREYNETLKIASEEF